MTDFGIRLKEVLHERSMTYEDLAEKTYMSKMAIYYYIKSDVLPTADNLKAICEALHVSADYMLGLEVRTHETGCNLANSTCSNCCTGATGKVQNAHLRVD